MFLTLKTLKNDAKISVK